MRTRKPMPDGFKQVRLARTSAMVLLLALLLNASEHVFAHLNGVPPAHQTVSHQVSHQDEPEQPNPASPFGSHDCLACRSLQHLRPSAVVTLVQFTTEVQALADCVA